jgi:RNA polymerase sigma factor (sigma-70 family)
LLNFRESPVNRFGKFRECVIKLCAILGRDPDELFPEHLRLEIPTNRISAYVEQRQLSGLCPGELSGAEAFENRDKAEMVNAVLATLPKKEALVLRRRFWDGKTQRETGKELGFSGGRIQQIEKKALLSLKRNTIMNEAK